MTHARRRLEARFRTALIALAAWLVAAFLAAPATAQPPPGAPLLDLAAILVMPAELEAEGMPGFGLDWSWTFLTIAEAMAPYTYADSRGTVSLADIPGAETVLRDAGWQRFHELSLSRLRPDDPALIDFYVSSSIEEYATADGAAQAFAAFSDPSALDAALDGEVELQPDAVPLGDQSVMWAKERTAPDSDFAPATVLTRMVRVGARIVSMSMFDFVDPAPIDPAPLDRLTSQLLGRLERAGPTGKPCPPAGATGIRAAITDRSGLHLPGLSTCVLRLDNIQNVPNQAHYTVLAGTALRMVNETPDALAERQADADTLGRRDTYRVQFTIEREGMQAFYTATIERYTDEAMATAAFAGLEDRLRADPDTPLVSFEPGVPVVGDGSATYVWTSPSTGNPITTSSTRIEDIVVTVRVSQTAEPIPAVTQSLLQAQVGCMQANDCTQPISVPPEIVPARPSS